MNRSGAKRITRMVAAAFAILIPALLLTPLPDALAQGNPMSHPDSNPMTHWDIRKTYFLRFKAAAQHGPIEVDGQQVDNPEGHDVIRNKESVGPGTIVHDTSGPVFEWPVQIPTAVSTVPTLRDEAIMENLFDTFGYPVSDTQFQIIERYNHNRFLEQLYDPEKIMWLATEIGGIQSNSVGNSAANMSVNQCITAIEYCSLPLANFTAEPDNVWQRIRYELFIPMAVLLLLPGAVLAQVRAIVAQGSPAIVGEVNPFDGIVKSVVAVFLIPGSFLVINYGIDVANSITYTIATEFRRIFNEDMYELAKCAIKRSYPINNPNSNRNAVVHSEEPEPEDGDVWRPDESVTYGLRFYDPCVGVDISRTPDEDVRERRPVNRLITNSLGASIGLTWNAMTAFQMVYLYYLWCMGPIAAALWVWPVNQLKKAFPNWCEGVLVVCFWSLFWNTVIFLLAAFKGVGDTGTIYVSALLILALKSVEYAFNFSQLVSGGAMSAAQQLASQSKPAGGGAGAPSGARGASPGSSAPGASGESGGGSEGVDSASAVSTDSATRGVSGPVGQGGLATDVGVNASGSVTQAPTGADMSSSVSTDPGTGTSGDPGVPGDGASGDMGVSSPPGTGSEGGTDAGAIAGIALGALGGGMGAAGASIANNPHLLSNKMQMLNNQGEFNKTSQDLAAEVPLTGDATAGDGTDVTGAVLDSATHTPTDPTQLGAQDLTAAGVLLADGNPMARELGLDQMSEKYGQNDVLPNGLDADNVGNPNAEFAKSQTDKFQDAVGITDADIQAGLEGDAAALEKFKAIGVSPEMMAKSDLGDIHATGIMLSAAGSKALMDQMNGRSNPLLDARATGDAAAQAITGEALSLGEMAQNAGATGDVMLAAGAVMGRDGSVNLQAPDAAAAGRILMPEASSTVASLSAQDLSRQELSSAGYNQEQMRDATRTLDQSDPEYQQKLAEQQALQRNISESMGMGPDGFNTVEGAYNGDVQDSATLLAARGHEEMRSMSPDQISQAVAGGDRSIMAAQTTPSELLERARGTGADAELAKQQIQGEIASDPAMLDYLHRNQSGEGAVGVATAIRATTGMTDPSALAQKSAMSQDVMRLYGTDQEVQQALRDPNQLNQFADRMGVDQTVLQRSIAGGALATAAVGGLAGYHIAQSRTNPDAAPRLYIQGQQEQQFARGLEQEYNNRAQGEYRAQYDQHLRMAAQGHQAHQYAVHSTLAPGVKPNLPGNEILSRDPRPQSALYAASAQTQEAVRDLGVEPGHLTSSDETTRTSAYNRLADHFQIAPGTPQYTNMVNTVNRGLTGHSGAAGTFLAAAGGTTAMQRLAFPQEPGRAADPSAIAAVEANRSVPQPLLANAWNNGDMSAQARTQQRIATDTNMLRMARENETAYQSIHMTAGHRAPANVEAVNHSAQVMSQFGTPETVQHALDPRSEHRNEALSRIATEMGGVVTAQVLHNSVSGMDPARVLPTVITAAGAQACTALNPQPGISVSRSAERFARHAQDPSTYTGNLARASITAYKQQEGSYAMNVAGMNDVEAQAVVARSMHNTFTHDPVMRQNPAAMNIVDSGIGSTRFTGNSRSSYHLRADGTHATGSHPSDYGMHTQITYARGNVTPQVNAYSAPGTVPGAPGAQYLVPDPSQVAHVPEPQDVAQDFNNQTLSYEQQYGRDATSHVDTDITPGGSSTNYSTGRPQQPGQRQMPGVNQFAQDADASRRAVTPDTSEGHKSDQQHRDPQQGYDSYARDSHTRTEGSYSEFVGDAPGQPGVYPAPSETGPADYQSGDGITPDATASSDYQSGDGITPDSYSQASDVAPRESGYGQQGGGLSSQSTVAYERGHDGSVPQSHDASGLSSQSRPIVPPESSATYSRDQVQSEPAGPDATGPVRDHEHPGHRIEHLESDRVDDAQLQPQQPSQQTPQEQPQQQPQPPQQQDVDHYRTSVDESRVTDVKPQTSLRSTLRDALPGMAAGMSSKGEDKDLISPEETAEEEPEQRTESDRRAELDLRPRSPKGKSKKKKQEEQRKLLEEMEAKRLKEEEERRNKGE